MSKPNRNRKGWTLAELYLLVKLRESKHTFADIASAMGRTTKAVSVRYHLVRKKRDLEEMAKELRGMGYETLPYVKNGKAVFDTRNDEEEIDDDEDEIVELHDQIADLEHLLKVRDKNIDELQSIIKEQNQKIDKLEMHNTRTTDERITELQRKLAERNQRITELQKVGDNSQYWRDKCEQLEKQLDEKSEQYDFSLVRYCSEELRLARKHNEMLMDKIAALMG